MQPADEIVHARGRPAPVDDAVLLGQPVRVGRLGVVLRPLDRVVACQQIDDGDQQACADPRERALDLFAGLVRPDGTMFLDDGGAGVERLDDPHDRDAGGQLAGDDGPMNRRGAAIARQQRGVHVDHAEPRDRQNRLGEDAPVRGDDAEVGVPAGQGVEKRRILHALRLQHGEAGRQRARLDRRVGHLLAAASRPVGLRDDADHGVRRRGEQRVQRRHGELRRAEEDDAKGRHGRHWGADVGLRRGAHHLPARVSFWIFRTIRSRLMPRRRSTKSAPSR